MKLKYIVKCRDIKLPKATLEQIEDMPGDFEYKKERVEKRKTKHVFLDGFTKVVIYEYENYHLVDSSETILRIIKGYNIKNTPNFVIAFNKYGEIACIT